MEKKKVPRENFVEKLIDLLGLTSYNIIKQSKKIRRSLVLVRECKSCFDKTCDLCAPVYICFKNTSYIVKKFQNQKGGIAPLPLYTATPNSHTYNHTLQIHCRSNGSIYTYIYMYVRIQILSFTKKFINIYVCQEREKRREVLGIGGGEFWGLRLEFSC